MFDFKAFRQSKGWSQTEAAEKLFGVTAPTWASMEQGKFNERKLAVYAKACQLHDEGIDLAFQPTPEQMRQVQADHSMSAASISRFMGHGETLWSSLVNGHIEWSKRWLAVVNATVALLNERAENQEPVQEVVSVAVAEPESFEHVQPILIDDKPFWIVADVCRSIGHSNSRVAVKLAREDDVIKVTAPDSMGRNVEQWAVNEYGLLRILAKSGAQKAEPFERWVFEDVLPSIRKTGSYSKQPASQADLFRATADLLETSERLKAEIQEIRQIAERASENSISTRDVISDLQRLDQKKIRLKDLVHAIVVQAKRQPPEDTEAIHFSKYGNVWRAVHRSATPAASKLSAYTTLAQIQTAINGAEFLLIQMGGIVPAEQLAFMAEAA